MLDFCLKTRIRFSLRDKRLFEITEVEITGVDCTVYKRYLAVANVLQSMHEITPTFAKVQRPPGAFNRIHTVLLKQIRNYVPNFFSVLKVVICGKYKNLNKIIKN